MAAKFSLLTSGLVFGDSLVLVPVAEIRGNVCRLNFFNKKGPTDKGILLNWLLIYSFKSNNGRDVTLSINPDKCKVLSLWFKFTESKVIIDELKPE